METKALPVHMGIRASNMVFGDDDHIMSPAFEEEEEEEEETLFDPKSANVQCITLS